MAREKDRGIFIDKIIGFESDPILSEKLHLLEHKGALEIVDVSVEDGNEDSSSPSTQRASFTVTPVNSASNSLAIYRDKRATNATGSSAQTYSFTVNSQTYNVTRNFVIHNGYSSENVWGIGGG